MLIPLKVDVPVARMPWVNITLIVLITLVTVAGFVDDGVFLTLSGIELVEASPLGGEGYYLKVTTDALPLPALAVTSSLLHADLIHLLGNMWFLWVFGNAVNERFGHFAYPALYLAAAMAGGLAHYATSGVPVVGASGAINGIMGAFVMFFAKNEVVVVWLIYLYPRLGKAPSVWAVAFWVAWDVVMLLAGGDSGVALVAHLAGFLAGLGIAALCTATGLIMPPEHE